MTFDRHAIEADKPVWNEVTFTTVTLQQMDDAYRKSSKATGALRDKLQNELRGRLEKKHANLLADSPDLEIAISFRFGKCSYALVTKTKRTKANANAVSV